MSKKPCSHNDGQDAKSALVTKSLYKAKFLLSAHQRANFAFKFILFAQNVPFAALAHTCFLCFCKKFAFYLKFKLTLCLFLNSKFIFKWKLLSFCKLSSFWARKILAEIKDLAILAIHAANASFSAHKGYGAFFGFALNLFHRVVIEKTRKHYHAVGILRYGLTVHAIFVTRVPMLHFFRPQIIKHSLYRRNLISTYN